MSDEGDRTQRILAAYRWIDENITTLAHEPPRRVLHNPMEVQVHARSDGTVTYPPTPTRRKTRAQQMREQFKRRRPAIVERLIERDGRVCYSCGEPIGHAKRGPNKLTVEHLVALNAGGDNHLDNLRLAHDRCNV